MKRKKEQQKHKHYWIYEKHNMPCSFTLLFSPWTNLETGSKRVTIAVKAQCTALASRAVMLYCHTHCDVISRFSLVKGYSPWWLHTLFLWRVHSKKSLFRKRNRWHKVASTSSVNTGRGGLHSPWHSCWDICPLDTMPGTGAPRALLLWWLFQCNPNLPWNRQAGSACTVSSASFRVPAGQAGTRGNFFPYHK